MVTKLRVTVLKGNSIDVRIFISMISRLRLIYYPLPKGQNTVQSMYVHSIYAIRRHSHFWCIAQGTNGLTASAFTM